VKKVEDFDLPKPLKVFLAAILFLVVFFYTNRLYEANLLWTFLLSIMFTLSVIIIGALLLLPILLVGGVIEIYLPKSKKFLKDFRQFLKDRQRN
jgi:hypothetical protein